MHRRLPIFFLADVSESMVGDPIQKVNDGIVSIVQALRNEPMALETAYLSIVSFAGKPKLNLPLTSLLELSEPKLSIGSGTNLGSALNFLMDEIEKGVVKGTQEQKGDWKPIVFILTDGHPTDDISRAVKRWDGTFRKKTNTIGISIGTYGDPKVLQSLTDEVFVLDNQKPDSFKKFFKWVSDSIQTNSRNINQTNERFNLEKNVDGLDRYEGKFQPQTYPFSFLLLKCSKTKKLYLNRYIKKGKNFVGDGSFPVNDEYTQLTSEDSGGTEMNVDLYQNDPPCPHCSNIIFAYCTSCDSAFCDNGKSGYKTCPWCKEGGEYELGSFDIKGKKG